MIATSDTVLSGRYRLREELGIGGMARVFQADDLRLQRVVAVKILHPQYLAQPEFVRRFAHEAQLAARLAHPHIVAIYDVGQDGDTPYIVMEYVAGDSLRDLIARAAPLPLRRVTPLMQQLGDALDAAHAQGVIHRDIKPENILLTADGQVKVSDFGIARALEEPRHTTTGLVLGSVAYMAPEQAQGRPTSGASDLYSSGVVLYELLTGRLPFVADSALATALLQVTQPPPLPSQQMPGLPAALDAAVLGALSKDPAQRFSSGAALTAALTRLGGAARWQLAPTLVVQSVGKRARPPGRVLAPLLTLLLGSAGLFAAFQWSGHNPPLSAATPPTKTSTATSEPIHLGTAPPRHLHTGAVVVQPARPTPVVTRSSAHPTVLVAHPAHPTKVVHSSPRATTTTRSSATVVTPTRVASATPHVAATTPPQPHPSATPPARPSPRPSATPPPPPTQSGKATVGPLVLVPQATPPRANSRPPNASSQHLVCPAGSQAPHTADGSHARATPTSNQIFCANTNTPTSLTQAPTPSRANPTQHPGGAATANLEVTLGRGVAYARLHLQHVAPGAAIAVRWTSPDRQTATTSLGPAYSTEPSYHAYDDVTTPGTYQLAVLDNGIEIATRLFSVPPTTSHAGSANNRPATTTPRSNRAQPPVDRHKAAPPHHHPSRHHPKGKGAGHDKH